MPAGKVFGAALRKMSTCEYEMLPSGKYPSGTLYSAYSKLTVTSFDCAVAGTAASVEAKIARTARTAGRQHNFRAGDMTDLCGARNERINAVRSSLSDSQRVYDRDRARRTRVERNPTGIGRFGTAGGARRCRGDLAGSHSASPLLARRRTARIARRFAFLLQ